MTIDEFKQENRLLRMALNERVFYAPPDQGYSRTGYTFDTDHDTALRDINYRDCALYPTIDEAVDAELAKWMQWATETKSQ